VTSPRADSSVGEGPRGPNRPRSSFTGRALILAVVAVTLFLALAVPVRTWFAQRAEIAQLRADVEGARDRVAALQLEKLRWDDPAFVAAEARRRLHFVLPGEIGYVTLGADATEEEIAALAAADEPWFGALWGAVRSADEANTKTSDAKTSDAKTTTKAVKTSETKTTDNRTTDKASDAVTG